MTSDHTIPVDGPLPWTRACFVCGEENPRGFQLKMRVEAGRVVADYVTRDSDRGYSEIVHGGLMMTLLDEVMAWAAIVRAGRVCVAAEVTTRLKQPIGIGRTLRIEGEITNARPRLLLAESRILGDDGELLLSGSGKYVPLEGAEAERFMEDFVSGGDAIDPATLLHGPNA